MYKNIIKKIYSGTLENYYNNIDRWLKKQEKKFIITVNPEIIISSNNDNNLKKMLSDENVSLTPDGISIIKAAKLLDIEIKERITGVDITKHLLEIAEKNNYSVFILGSHQEILEALKAKYTNVNFLDMINGYVANREEEFKKISILKPDIIIVALGVPKQEELIYKYFNYLKKGVFIGVGGSLDVLSGFKRRAPKFFIKTNMEWFYRIICEPKRLKRFFKYNIKFMFEIKKEIHKYD